MAKIDYLYNKTIRDIFENYKDCDEAGVTGMNGKLNIRPAYQREYVYDNTKRTAVIKTILKYGAKALGVIWFARNEDNTYELMDGQQRTISYCQYLNGDFAVDNKYFSNQPADIRNQILDQELMISIFEGTESEKLEWFKTINIAGERLSDQELRNAAYTGPWLSDAKRYFSKTGCVAYNIGNKYVKGAPLRQDYLEAALSWISNKDIESYMAEHQHDTTAKPLWDYFLEVINWVKKIFPNWRKEMQGIAWGLLYNKYKDMQLDSDEVEATVSKLMQDADVTNHKGIYEYIFDNDEKHLNLRTFDEKQKRRAFERQHGYCPRCYALHLPNAGHKFTQPGQMQGDHMTSWKHGGASTDPNLVMLCPECNSDKSGSDEYYSPELIAEMINTFEGVN